MYETLHFHFDRVCGDFGCKLVETNGEKDHVHLLIEPLPHTTPSRLVNSLKGGLWSPSYFIASCGGTPLDIVKNYIENS